MSGAHTIPSTKNNTLSVQTKGVPSNTSYSQSNYRKKNPRSKSNYSTVMNNSSQSSKPQVQQQQQQQEFELENTAKLLDILKSLDESKTVNGSAGSLNKKRREGDGRGSF